jgi:hypothetical protein
MAPSTSVFPYTPIEQFQNSNKRKVYPVSPYPAPAANGFLAARFPETTPPATPEESQNSSEYGRPTSSVGIYASDVPKKLFSPSTTPSRVNSADEKAYNSSPIRTGQMSVPLVVKQTKKSGVVKKKFAEGLASLYDDVESSLQSPLWKTATPVTSTTRIPGRSVKPIKPVHGVKPEVTVGLPLKDIYERHEGDTTIAIDTLWIGTSQFLTEHCFNLQMDVSTSQTFFSIFDNHWLQISNQLVADKGCFTGLSSACRSERISQVPCHSDIQETLSPRSSPGPCPRHQQTWLLRYWSSYRLPSTRFD